MRIPVANDGWPWIFGSLVTFVGLGLVISLLPGSGLWPVLLYVVGVAHAGFMVYFFRDPERAITAPSGALLAGADGTIRAVEELPEDRFLKTDAVRVSVYLSPWDVHINRAPLAGTVRALEYTPGRHLLTMRNAASEYNEHSSILIEGASTRCLVKQIVGPVVRRVVYWLQPGQDLACGERIGMMKFGSRLDMYFPRANVDVCVKKGDKVKAGITPVATLKGETSS
jgi:phosphatidylserine decarboxylase